MHTLDISLDEIVEFIKANTHLLHKDDLKHDAKALTADSDDLKKMLDLLEQIEDGDRTEKEIDGIHHSDYSDHQIEIGEHSIADVIDHVKELVGAETVGGSKRKSRKNKRSRKSRKSRKTKRSRKSRKSTRRRRVRRHR